MAALAAIKQRLPIDSKAGLTDIENDHRQAISMLTRASKYPSDIGGLQAFAVLLVAVFRFKSGRPVTDGFVGVDVFSVISICALWFAPRNCGQQLPLGVRFAAGVMPRIAKSGCPVPGRIGKLS
jgi:hypothetical protein